MKEKDTKMEQFRNHPNPHNLTYSAVITRMRKHNMTFEEAITTKTVMTNYKTPNGNDVKAGVTEAYRSHSNPYNIGFNTAIKRVHRLGITMDEALSYPGRMKSKESKKEFDQMDNPYGINYEVFKSRVRNGETPEEALGYKRKMRENKDRKGVVGEFYKLENPHNISLSTFRKRVSEGMTPKEAMSEKLKFQNSNDLKEFYDKNINKSNIDYELYLSRVKAGLSKEQAIYREEIECESLKQYFDNHENPHKVSYQTFRLRIQIGLNHKEALSFPSKRKESNKEYFDNHENPYNIPYKTFVNRIKRMSKEKAMSYPLRTASKEKEAYKKHNNHHNLTWHAVYDRIKNQGMTFEEAINKPLDASRKLKSGISFENYQELYDNHPNPHNLTKAILRNRLNKGLSFEEAMSIPKQERRNFDKEREIYNNHENPYNLSWDTVYSRLMYGKTMEQAMNMPVCKKT